MNKRPIWLLGLATALLALGCSEQTPSGLENQPAGLEPRLQAVISVDIDIKPDSDPNCFNNDGHGVIPVAILSCFCGFDASTVDPNTVMLDGLSVAVRGRSNKLLAHIEDVNEDGLLDLVVQIEDVVGAFTSGSGTATLTGQTFGGQDIQGTDAICIVP